jgi:2,4-dienoyl-CoA reductase-like NADH-dependent reductase (Old Yellow Enzyme family)
VAGWKAIVRAVHDAGGLIVAQLWHMGQGRERAALNSPNTKTFYTPGPAGYTDYPALIA